MVKNRVQETVYEGLVVPHGKAVVQTTKVVSGSVRVQDDSHGLVSDEAILDVPRRVVEKNGTTPFILDQPATANRTAIDATVEPVMRVLVYDSMDSIGEAVEATYPILTTT